MSADGPPFLRVVRGNPTPEEVAALVAVLLEPEEAGPPARPRRRGRSAWADPAHVMRRARHPIPVRGSHVSPGG